MFYQSFSNLALFPPFSSLVVARLLGDRRRHATLQNQLITSSLDALFGGAVSLGASAILLVAAGSMRTGAFSIGDFALFVYNLSLVTDVISFSGTLLVRYKQAGVSMGRMAGLLQGGPPEELVAHSPVYLSGPLPDIPVVARTDAHYLDTLEARELTYHYPSSGRGIQGIGLRVPRGQCVVITGRVDAGKTTLLRVLLGLLPSVARRLRGVPAVMERRGAGLIVEMTLLRQVQV